MVRVRVEVWVTTKVLVRVRVRDQKQISRDCALASELVQLTSPKVIMLIFQKNADVQVGGSLKTRKRTDKGEGAKNMRTSFIDGS